MTPTDPLRLRVGRDWGDAFLEVGNHHCTLTAAQARQLLKALLGERPAVDVVLEACPPAAESAHLVPAPPLPTPRAAAADEPSILVRRRSDVRQPRRRAGNARGHGGAGRRHVTSLRDPHRLLRDMGFDVDDQPSPHTKITRGGMTHTLPRTPSDYRSLMNTIKSIENRFQISLARPS